MKIIRCYVIFILITILLITFSSCSPLRSAYSITEGLYINTIAELKSFYYNNIKYDVDWMMGKTRQEIIDRYGEFDLGTPQTSFSAYKTRERTKGFMDLHREEFLFIYFNTDGIAYDYDLEKILPGDN